MNMLRCSVCGAGASAACCCGAPYVAPGIRAIDAVKANPGKSDRAIAAEIGVGPETVRRARKSTASDEAVRIGKDGKMRRLPKRKPTVQEPENFLTALMIRADQAVNSRDVAEVFERQHKDVLSSIRSLYQFPLIRTRAPTVAIRWT
jgi:hypothetical protein